MLCEKVQLISLFSPSSLNTHGAKLNNLYLTNDKKQGLE